MDKFKAMVERAIERGLDLSVLLPKVEERYNIAEWHAYSAKLVITVELDPSYVSISPKFRDYKLSLSDILFNHEFMRALLVDKGCNGIKHLLAMREAAQLPTDQQRIDYVHGLIKGESE